MDVDERRRLVEVFLRRCVTYADASIERKKQRGEDEGIIAQWQDYRDFTDHAADEVASGSSTRGSRTSLRPQTPAVDSRSPCQACV